jgi:hypothetical protein
MLVCSLDEFRESCDSFDSCAKRRAPRACYPSHFGGSFHDGTVVDNDSNEARCRTTDHRATATATATAAAADDIRTSRRSTDHRHHTSAGAKPACFAVGAGEPGFEYAAGSGLLRCLLF